MKGITRRSVVFGALAMPAIARAQSRWPSGTITIVVPAPAGGSVDVIARLVQPALSERLGATVIVENRAGAATMLGASAVAKAPPDGGRWLVNADPQVLNPLFRKTLPYDPKDLDPILLVGTSPNVLATRPDKPFKTLADVIAAGRKPDGVTTAVISDTLAFVSMVLLGKIAKTQIRLIPYKGGAPAMNDALGGQVDLIAGSASLLAPQFASNRLRGIAQTGTRRHPALTAIPTVAEGGFSGFNALSFWGFYGRAGTPPAIVDRFVKEVGEILTQADVTERLQRALMVDVGVVGPSEFRSFFDRETQKWGEVIRENGLAMKS